MNCRRKNHSARQAQENGAVRQNSRFVYMEHTRYYYNRQEDNCKSVGGETIKKYYYRQEIYHHNKAINSSNIFLLFYLTAYIKIGSRI